MKYKFYRFMQGRYGNDQLNNCLIITGVVSAIINMFFRSYILTIVSYLFMFLYLFRFFSRNVIKRREENKKFNQFFRPITKRSSVIRKNWSDKNNKYFICPSCKQTVRVPKGKGSLTITCPTCRTKFDKRT